MPPKDKIAILTGGGDVPGLNPVIKSVVYRASQLGRSGVGIRKGDIFCMTWISAGQAGITLYQIEKNHRMIGDYTRLGGPGILSREVLTRVDYD